MYAPYQEHMLLLFLQAQLMLSWCDDKHPQKLKCDWESESWRSPEIKTGKDYYCLREVKDSCFGYLKKYLPNL